MTLPGAEFDELAPVHWAEDLPASDVESSTNSDWVGRCGDAQKPRR